MKRKTIIFTGKDQVELTEEAIPQPRHGEVLVETTRSMISTGTESIVFTRNFAPGTHWDAWAKYPFRPGYLSSGRVIALGEGVTGWKIGDRIASRGGHSSHNLVGTLNAAGKPVGKEGESTPSSVGMRIPEGVSDQDAAWMGLGKIVQVGIRAAEHKLGDNVVVVGLGLLGQLVVQYVRLLGAANVIAIDTAPKRLEMAAAHGATMTLQSTAADALERVNESTDGQGADVVYDVTGAAPVMAQCLPLVRRFGTLLLLGDTGTPGEQRLTPDVIRRGLKIVGVHDSHPPQLPSTMARWSAVQIYELFLLFLSRGQMRVSDLVTHHFKPEQAKDAYALLQRERQTAMGVVFDWK